MTLLGLHLVDVSFAINVLLNFALISKLYVKSAKIKGS